MRVTRWTAVAAIVLAAGCGMTNDGAISMPRPTLPPPVAVTTPPPTTPPAPPKTLVATATSATVKAFDSPSAAGAPVGSFSNPTQMDVPLVFRVKAVQSDWLEVMLPMRPNGVAGWIQSKDVTLSESEWRAKVELGNHRLIVWRGNEVVEDTTVAVGMPTAPTPLGDFYLTEVLDTGNPGGSYGPWAFGLSAYSDVYTEFAGGPGQIGMHGTNAPGALGTDASHGCIRVANETITKLASELPVGSPITVTA